MNMLVFQFHHYLKPEFIETYRAAVLENAAHSVKEPGILRFEVFQDAEDPTHFSLLEIYHNQASRDAHTQTEHFFKWRETVPDEMFARKGSANTFILHEPLFPDPEVTSDSPVILRVITKETAREIGRLKVAEAQRVFVAPIAVSIAQAYFEPKAWFRAVFAGETPVGFVMLLDNPDESEYYLWRYMIDARYQGMGFGRKALEQVIEYVKTRPRAMELLTSCVPGEGGPCPFYERLGFVYTGEEDDGELVMRLKLTEA
jgi:diamine N-acetyltransferase